MGNYNAIRPCQLCGKEFAGRRTSSRFCSKACSTKVTGKTRKQRGTCQLCGVECHGATVVICAACRQGDAVRVHDERRFWAKVRRGKPDECWEWIGGSVNKNGYGLFHTTEPRKMVSAHRYAWKLTHGDAGELLVCHRCDNVKCTNPGHLFLGTHQDNQADKVAKGRQARGERAGHARLTEAMVRDIRARHAAGESFVAIADELCLRVNTVARAANRETWRHVA